VGSEAVSQERTLACPPKPVFLIPAKLDAYKLSIDMTPIAMFHRTIKERKSRVQVLLFGFFLLVAVQPCFAWSENDSSGTIVAFSCSREGIVIAADSRRRNGIQYVDDACKISTPQNQFVFVSTGISNWAHEEVISLAQVRVRTPAGIPQEWATRMRSHLLNTPKAQVLGMVETVGRIVSVGMFVIKMPTGAEAHRIFLEYRELGDGRFDIVQHDDFPGRQKMPQVIGFLAAFNEIVGGATDRGRAARDVIESHFDKSDFQAFSVIYVAEETVDWYGGVSSHVGGKIDAVKMLQNGSVQWIRRKANCPER
jgi:hypothetical protein